MSLSLIFRLQAAFAGIWALQLVFIPEMVFTQYNWTPSFESVLYTLLTLPTTHLVLPLVGVVCF